MKFILVLASLFIVALGAPLDSQVPVAQIIKSENNNVGLDNYNFSYETSDGIARYEQGALKNVGTENEALETRGSYSYVGSDGKQYIVNYVADENGFRPEGAHLPVV